MKVAGESRKSLCGVAHPVFGATPFNDRRPSCRSTVNGRLVRGSLRWARLEFPLNWNFRSNRIAGCNSEFRGSVMSKFSEHEWHEFPWAQAPEMPAGPHKKVKIYADVNIPRTLIDELRTAGLPIESAVEAGYSTHPDENICQQANKRRKVLLTMDRDFWNDRKHPPQKTRGIIFIDIPPDQPEKAIAGLARFYALFAKYYPLNSWEGTKARITEYGFVIKYRTREGRLSEDEFHLTDNGKLVTRRLR